MGKGKRIKAQRHAGGTSTRGGRSGHVPVRRPIPWFAITVAAIIVAALMALLWPTGSKKPSPSFKHSAYSEISLDDTPALATFSGSYTDAPSTDPAAGMDSPRVSGESPTGSEVAIGGSSSQPTLLIFLAHWCPHCQREVPQLQSWITKNGSPDDIAIISVATASSSTKPNYPPATWLDREGWSSPVLLDDEVGSAGIAYGADSYPYFVLLGADGKVIRRASGEISTATWESYIARLRNSSATVR